MKKELRTLNINDEAVLAFLQSCDKIENRTWATDDGNTYNGWMFTLLVSHLGKDIDDSINPTDMTIAVRGEYKLMEAARVAMAIKKNGF
jgi:hypothetical protein